MLSFNGRNVSANSSRQRSRQVLGLFKRAFVYLLTHFVGVASLREHLLFLGILVTQRVQTLTFYLTARRALSLFRRL